MIVMPHLDGVRRRYSQAGCDAQAARAALAVLGSNPLPLPQSRPLEHAALAALIERWLAEQRRGLRLHDPMVKVFTGGDVLVDVGDPEATVYLHVGNPRWECWHSVWNLQPRWSRFEQAPGLVSAALAEVFHAGQHGFPVFEPMVAEYWAENRYGWDDVPEEEQAEYEGLTRAQFERSMPPDVRCPVRLRDAALARFARRRGDIGELARRVAELRAVLKRSCRRKGKIEVLYADPNNGTETLGYAVTLRWRSSDPLGRIFDDHADMCMQSEGFFESYFFSAIAPAQLPLWMTEMEHRFAIARLVEGILPLIAVKART